jgi:hypothetical protein
MGMFAQVHITRIEEAIAIVSLAGTSKARIYQTSRAIRHSQNNVYGHHWRHIAVVQVSHVM